MNDGRPLQFLAQFCFADSTDLFPKLPGDVMVIFIDAPDGLEEWFWGDRVTRLEWVRFTDGPVLKKLPPGVKPVVDHEWYGVRHRTSDYPRAIERVRKLDKDDDDLFEVPVINGTKIGGAIATFHGRAPRGRLLCRLASIWPSRGFAFPWTNRRTKKHDAKLSLGDAGCLSFFLMPNGRVRVSFDSH